MEYYGFRFVKATSDELKEKIYRLRYKTYVEEFGFLKAEDNPGGLETDIYEPHSIHFAALDQEDEVVGTIRLVLDSENGFPIEPATGLKVDERSPREKSAEISRLTVSKKMRKRKEDETYGVRTYLEKSKGGVLPNNGSAKKVLRRRRLPAIILGLCQVMYHESKRLQLTHWYMITEKIIFYTLSKFGFIFKPIGEPVEYHGLRIPYSAEIDWIEKGLIRENPVFMKMLLKGLEPQFHPKFGLSGFLRINIRRNFYSQKAKNCMHGRRVERKKRRR